MAKRKAVYRKPTCTCRNTLNGETCLVCSVGSKAMLNIPAKHTKPVKQATKKYKAPQYTGGVVFKHGKHGISNFKMPSEDGKKLVLTKYCI